MEKLFIFGIILAGFFTGGKFQATEVGLAKVCVSSGCYNVTDSAETDQDGFDGQALIGGSPAGSSKPVTYMGSLQVRINSLWQHVCTVVLISPHRCLVAADCTYHWGKHRHRVALGLSSLIPGSGGKGAQYLPVVSVRRRGTREDILRTRKNNLAVLVLGKCASFTRYVKPIKLASKKDGDFAGEECSISGFGADGSAQSARTFGITNNQCKAWAKVLAPNLKIVEEFLCIYNYAEGVGICDGDAGSPVVCRGKLAAIASWTFPTAKCSSCYPQGTTRIRQFTRWVRK